MGKTATPRALPDNEAKAVARMIRVSPQKLNLVAQSIRGRLREDVERRWPISSSRASASRAT